MQQKSQFIFPSYATSQNFLRVSRSPSHAGQRSLINHNLWSQTLKLLELEVKGEALLLPGHSPGQVRNPTWLPRHHPDHLEKAPGEHQPSRRLDTLLESTSPAAASLPAWLMVGGQANNSPWKKVGAGMPASKQPAASRPLPSGNTLPVLPLSILQPEYLYLRPQSWCLSAEDPKSCSAQRPRAHFPALWRLGLLGPGQTQPTLCL